MIVQHINDIIRYSQKKMTEKIYFVYLLYLRTDMWEAVLFLHFQR